MKTKHLKNQSDKHYEVVKIVRRKVKGKEVDIAIEADIGSPHLSMEVEGGPPFGLKVKLEVRFPARVRRSPGLTPAEFQVGAAFSISSDKLDEVMSNDLLPVHVIEVSQ